MSNDDSITLGGIPAASLAARRAKRESGGAITDRPTQPMPHARGDMPVSAPAPHIPPPDRQRASDLARAFLSGAEAQRVVGRDGCEEMARWIEAQPDYRAAIDEWRVAVSAVERSRRSGDEASDGDLRRLDDTERALAALSCDQRAPNVRRRSLIDVDARRIWTARDDGSCGVCGMFRSAHRIIGGEERCPGQGVHRRSQVAHEAGAMKRLVFAACACSWLGQLPTRAPCPACGLSHYDRISPERAAMLEALAQRPTPLAEKPMMRRAFIKLGLAAPVSERRPPGGNGKRRPPAQLFAITSRGARALEAYRDLVALQRAEAERQAQDERDKQLRRSIAAEAAARHADLPG